MTVTTEVSQFTPVRDLPNGGLFYSSLGLFDFQAEGVAQAYLKTEPGTHGGVLGVWDTGLGKTILALALAGMLFEDGKIDMVMLLCERNKLKEWAADVEKFTGLSVHRYHGQGRQKRLVKAGIPHIFLTTHETGRNELLSRVKVKGKRGKGQAADGALMDTLGLRSKRILWVFDEPKLRTRTSEMHQAYSYVLRTLRKGPFHQRFLGLTATPTERDIGDTYNLCRIAAPSLVPTVGEFEDTYTRGKDDYDRYVFKPERKADFGKLVAPVILRKRKSDPDVREQFPEQIEKVLEVEATAEQRRFYTSVANLLPAEDDRLWTLLRMTAGHPASHIHAPNPVSKAIVAAVGEQALRDIGSAKCDELITRLKPLVKGQGAQAIVFCYYGKSVLIEVARELRAAGFTVVEYHGGKTTHANEQAQDEFLAGRAEILLASDAAAKGLNMPNGEYVFEYESAITYATRIQRINRVNRIDSVKACTTCFTLVLRDTVEDHIFARTLQRNADQDIVLGDEEDDTAFVSASMRKRMLALSKR